MRGYEIGGVGYINAVGGGVTPTSIDSKSRPNDYKLLTGPRHIQGYATLYSVPHKYKGRFDAFMPGCFSRSLASKRAIRMHLMHKVSDLLATTEDRLEIIGDEHGIAFRCELPNNELGEQVKRSSLAGELTGMSVGYQVIDSKVKDIGDGDSLHLIRDADLFEISVGDNGVVQQAFAKLIDVSEHSSLAAESKSGVLLKSGENREIYKTQAERRREALAAYGITEYFQR